MPDRYLMSCQQCMEASFNDSDTYQRAAPARCCVASTALSPHLGALAIWPCPLDGPAFETFGLLDLLQPPTHLKSAPCQT